MQPHERLAFSPIETRPPLRLPDGLRLILWPLMSLEQWDISRPMARMVITPPQGQPMLPDHPNWSWHEYGMRVGFWRLKRVFERLKMTPTVTVNGRACEAYPQVIQAVADAGWELNAHGYDQIPMHKVEDQLGSIKKAIDIVGKFWGRPPRGWFGPGPDADLRHARLSVAGRHRIYRRLGARRRAGDLKTTHKPVVALPYNFELHDIVMMALQNHPSEEMHRRSMDAFDCLYEELKGRAKIMSIACIPICPDRRTASSTSSAPSRTFCPSPASPAGAARKFSTGISARKRKTQSERLLRPARSESAAQGCRGRPARGAQRRGQGHVRHRRRTHRRRQSGLARQCHARDGALHRRGKAARRRRDASPARRSATSSSTASPA